APRPSRGRRPSRAQLVAAGVVLAVLAAVLPFVLREHGKPPPASATSVRADSVAVLDAATGRIVDDVPMGSRPTAIAAGAGAIWVANAANGTVSRIDTTSRQVQTIQVGGAPVSLAVGFGAVWAVNGDGRTVFQINATANKLVGT